MGFWRKNWYPRSCFRLIWFHRSTSDKVLLLRNCLERAVRLGWYGMIFRCGMVVLGSTPPYPPRGGICDASIGRVSNLWDAALAEFWTFLAFRNMFWLSSQHIPNSIFTVKSPCGNNKWIPPLRGVSGVLYAPTFFKTTLASDVNLSKSPLIPLYKGGNRILLPFAVNEWHFHI